MLLQQYMGVHLFQNLGQVKVRTDIPSSIGPFRFLPEYTTIYPRIVVQALGELYAEYNREFISLAERNREWETDYQFCMVQDEPCNWAVQIDMVGLPEGFLHLAPTMSLDKVREILRKGIFEVENSLAMYGFLREVFSKEGRDSFFKSNFQTVLDRIRQQFGRPIALLAVTEEKFEAMKVSEFGREADEEISDKDVFEISGFDRFFGPAEFLRYIEENGGQCHYLLYIRSSDPVAKLKKPEVMVDHPLLSDSDLRRIIKAHALTFNVDDPSWGIEDARRINDTKMYMPKMGMGFLVKDAKNLFSPEFAGTLTSGKGSVGYTGARLSPALESYLLTQGADPRAVTEGTVVLRCKPTHGTYGCYGHLSGIPTEGEFRRKLAREIRNRGPYVVQMELTTSKIANATEGISYNYIDRNFFAMVGGKPTFLGGFRSMMPVVSVEAMKGRNHGNSATVWAEIVSAT